MVLLLWLEANAAPAQALVEEERVARSRGMVAPDVHVRAIAPLQTVREYIMEEVPVLPPLGKAERLTVQDLAALFSIPWLRVIEEDVDRQQLCQRPCACRRRTWHNGEAAKVTAKRFSMSASSKATPSYAAAPVTPHAVNNH